MFDFYALYESFGGDSDLHAYGRFVDYLEQESGCDDLDELEGWEDFYEDFLADPDGEDD